MFAVNNYLKIWEIKKSERGNYYEVDGSTSRKNRDTGEYENDFSSKYIRFVGKAKDAIEAGDVFEKGVVKILSCGVTTSYNRETKKGYTNFVVFEVEPVESKGAERPAKTEKKKSEKEKVAPEGYETSDDDLPF